MLRTLKVILEESRRGNDPPDVVVEKVAILALITVIIASGKIDISISTFDTFNTIIAAPPSDR